MAPWRQAAVLALASFKAGQGTLQRKKNVATVAEKKAQHTRCAQLRIRRRLARARKTHRLQESEEAKHDGHATQAATETATMAGAEAKEIVPTVPVVCVSPVATPPLPCPSREAEAAVVQPESNNEKEKKEEAKEEEGKEELAKMPGPQKATSSVVEVPLPSREGVEAEKDEKRKKKKKKKSPSKTVEMREPAGMSWDLSKLTGRELLDNLDTCVAEGQAVPSDINAPQWRLKLSRLDEFELDAVVQPKRRSGRLHPNQTAV